MKKKVDDIGDVMIVLCSFPPSPTSPMGGGPDWLSSGEVNNN